MNIHLAVIVAVQQAVKAPTVKDQSVKRGDTIRLKWESDFRISSKISIKWKKNGQKLDLDDEDRIDTAELDDRKVFILMIEDAEEQDEGKYTLELSYGDEMKSSTAEVKVLEYDEDWREMDWDKTYEMSKRLKAFEPCKKDVTLRFLLHGPVGAGKSSVINSINCTLQGRNNVNALAAATSGRSHTKFGKTHPIMDHNGETLPFAFIDIMGMENDKGGVLTADLINILKGRVKEGYKFNPMSKLTEEDLHYNSSPTLNDKVHCLVSVIPADKITIYAPDDGVMTKMREVREAASDLEIPQVIFMTHVDRCCSVVNEDLTRVYSSKKVKLAMQHCKNKLGVPMNCIFPLKNYHEEKDMNIENDCLIVDAMQQIAHFANDYVKSHT